MHLRTEMRLKMTRGYQLLVVGFKPATFNNINVKLFALCFQKKYVHAVMKGFKLLQNIFLKDVLCILNIKIKQLHHTL